MKMILEYAFDAFGKLITSDGLSAITGISCERITELVDNKLIPHVRIDNGPPLFRKTDAVQWLKDNLVQKYEGKPLPIQFIVSTEIPASGPIPKNMARMADQLREVIGIPKCSCVYFMYVGEECVYVGQTTSIMARIGAHQGNGKTWERFFWLPCPANQLDDVETWWQRHLKPKLNVQIDWERQLYPPQELICEANNGTS